MRELPTGIEDRVMGDSYEPDGEDVPMNYGASIVYRQRAALPAMATTKDNVTVSLGGSEDAIMDVLREQHVMDPAVLDDAARKPFFWPAEISSSRLDTYDTRMDPETTLKNYSADAAVGVAFCDSHEHNEQAFGRSFAGIFVPGTAVADANTPDPATTYAAFYTFPGLQVNRVNTTHLIDSIRMGIARDVSVGFKPDVGFIYRCSICGENLWSWDCRHIPGDTENVVVDEASGRTEERYVYAWVCNARLSEVSSVYDGSTPWAMIIKAVREARAGRIPDRTAQLVESMTRFHLPKRRALLPGHRNEKTRRTEMPRPGEEDDEKAATLTRQASQARAFDKYIRGVLTKARVELDPEDEGEDLIRRFRGHLDELTERATRGDTAFDQLIKMSLAQGVRAVGADKFDAKKWEQRLRKMDPDEVVEQGSGWKEEADRALKAGRVSRDAEDADEDEDEDEDDERSARSEDRGEGAPAGRKGKRTRGGDPSLPPADLFSNV